MRASPPTVVRIALLALACCGSWPPAASAAERSASYLSALESIRAEDLRRHVEYLADDKLEGREAGRRGGRVAAQYVAKALGELGLAPAGVDSGFFQPFPPNYRNVLARLKGSDSELSDQVVIVGAHYDHVGYGSRRNSRGPVGDVHNGADDNASGTSALLELAEALTMLPEPPRRSVLFAAWDAEEKGLLGSKHFAAHPLVPIDRVVAVLNMDMIGRLRAERLTVFGTRSACGLRRLVSRNNQGPGLKIDFSWSLSATADHYPFFCRDVPVLMAHTGEHEDYHSPRDDARLINNAGMSRVVRLLFGVVYDLADQPQRPDFRPKARRETEATRAALARGGPRPPDRLGVAWQPRSSAADGLRLTRVLYGSPAQKAELRPGDRIVRFAGREIRSGDDLRGAVMGAENPAVAVVRRSGSPEPFEVTVELDGDPVRLGISWRTDDAEPGTVILTHVIPGSPAARAGLRSGDRVYQIAGRDFADDAEFAELAKTLPEPLELLVERNGQLRAVVLYIRSEPPVKAA
ncbi:MAG: M28 family peptidase [Pirellulales bacterium]|nr:M28 family peptidase [Pirellulales bacterium]